MADTLPRHLEDEGADRRLEELTVEQQSDERKRDGLDDELDQKPAGVEAPHQQAIAVAQHDEEHQEGRQREEEEPLEDEEADAAVRCERHADDGADGHEAVKGPVGDMDALAGASRLLLIAYGGKGRLLCFVVRLLRVNVGLVPLIAI